jgi:hypothetical protein
MYHEERIINGRLCWRGTPDGEFKEYTPEELAVKLQMMQYELSTVRLHKEEHDRLCQGENRL